MRQKQILAPGYGWTRGRELAMNLRVNGSQNDVTFLLVLLVASLGFNAFLGREYWRHAHKSSFASLPDLGLGETVPPLQVKTLDGRSETIAYTVQPQPTVVYVFTPSCPWCRKNVNNIKHLTATKASTFRFVGISLDPKGLEAYLAQHNLKFPVYVDPTPESRLAYHLGNVPHTLVISQDSTVLKTWRGAYIDSRAEVEEFFKVTLPGLSDDRDGAVEKQISTIVE
jgi:peroxiredoxin